MCQLSKKNVVHNLKKLKGKFMEALLNLSKKMEIEENLQKVLKLFKIKKLFQFV